MMEYMSHSEGSLLMLNESRRFQLCNTAKALIFIHLSLLYYPYPCHFPLFFIYTHPMLHYVLNFSRPTYFSVSTLIGYISNFIMTDCPAHPIGLFPMYPIEHDSVFSLISFIPLCYPTFKQVFHLIQFVKNMNVVIIGYISITGELLVVNVLKW